jgi:pSer/pThr/pTyr-binding forkhead associated (FHA) protein
MAKTNTKTRPDLTRAAAQPAPRLVLQIESPQRRLLTVNFVSGLVIGRGGDDDPKQPDVDLNPVGGKDAGVSRLHARLTFTDDTLFIEDMNSTNGTRINGFELVGGESYRLTAGDEVELGSLRLTLRLTR